MSDSHDPTDLLGLSSDEREVLLDELDSDQAGRGNNRRSKDRVNCRELPDASLELLEAGDPSQRSFLVRPRNLSPSGIAFLHGSFVHPKSKARITLTDLSGETVTLEGKVAWCRHVKARVHEVALQFNERIDLNRFLRGSYRGYIPSRFDGDAPEPYALTVLAVTSSDVDRRVLAYHLERLGVRVTTVESIEQLVSRHAEFDIAFVGLEEGDFDPEKLAGQISTPLIGITPDDSRTAPSGMRFLFEPYNLDGLSAMLDDIAQSRAAAAA